jgi:hypothetical protein
MKPEEQEWRKQESRSARQLQPGARQRAAAVLTCGCVRAMLIDDLLLSARIGAGWEKSKRATGGSSPSGSSYLMRG